MTNRGADNGTMYTDGASERATGGAGTGVDWWDRTRAECITITGGRAEVAPQLANVRVSSTKSK